MFIIKLLVFFLILTIIVVVHEFGHFICAKKSGVHIYEFSIGMGPCVFSHKGKDGIKYNYRLFPIGGYVSMAGEVYEDADDDIPKDKFMCNRPWWQRIIILCAGVFNNFVLAIVLLFVMSSIWGGEFYEPIVNEVLENSSFSQAGINPGDKILKINGNTVSSWDVAQIILAMDDKDNVYEFVIEHEDKNIETYKIIPHVRIDEETKTEAKSFGFSITTNKTNGFFDNVKYSFWKFKNVVVSMYYTLYGLFSGQISVSALSGPVGIYQVVSESMNSGLYYLVYITAYLSINVGVLNILPFPAFDGGRVFFLIIEKIKGSKINAEFENMCHLIGFALLMILMIYISVKDVIGLFI